MWLKTASLMTLALVSGWNGREQPVVTILVATSYLEAGTVIKRPAEMFQEANVLLENAPRNAVSRFDELRGRQLKIRRQQGETIRENDLYEEAPLGTGLAAGYRAFGLRVGHEQTEDGFTVQPQMRIDIACMVRDEHQKSGVRLILQNVLVLASGQFECGHWGGQFCDIVTVALTPYDALKLETAKNRGGILLFARPISDRPMLKVGDMTWEVVKGPSKEQEDEDDLPIPRPSEPASLDAFLQGPTRSSWGREEGWRAGSTLGKTVTFGTTVKIEVTVTVVSK